MTRVETLIIGGGPAGAAAGCALAAGGREVTLIERSAGPHHKVCGEFLSIETQQHLWRLGVDAANLGAVAIEDVAIYAAARATSARLPFRGLSLSRYRLDDALLRRAAACGAKVKRGVAVKELTRDRAGYIARCDDGATIQCRHPVLATGKSAVRGVRDGRDSSLVGLKVHVRLAPTAERALAGRVELALLPGGYAGLEMVEDGVANLCLVLPRVAVARLSPGWPPLQAYLAQNSRHFSERLSGATALWEKPLAVVCPGRSHLHRDEDVAVYRIGDRLAHIPPFTGDGLAIALASAALATAHIERGAPPASYLAAARRLLVRPLRLAGAVAGLAANQLARPLLMEAAVRAPALIGALTRATRLPLAIH